MPNGFVWVIRGRTRSSSVLASVPPPASLARQPAATDIWYGPSWRAGKPGRHQAHGFIGVTMQGSPRLRGTSLLAMSRVSARCFRARRIRGEPTGPETAMAAAPAIPPLPPEGARLAEEAAAFLADQRAGEARDDPRGQRAYRILLPYTDSEPAQRALEAAVEWSSLFTAEVWVLHVREWDNYGRGGPSFLETREEAIAVIGHAVERLRGHGLQASGVLQDAPRGRVSSEIVLQACALRADAIVLGSRRRPLISAALFGSVSLGLRRRANCPVVLVHTPRR